jgi:hypothetical protein
MPPKRQEGHPPLLGDRIIYEEYVKQKEDASKTSEALRKEGSTYPTRKQVAKAVKRMLDNTSAEYWVRKQKGAQGRLPVLDAIGIQNLVDEAERAKNENRIIRLNVKQAHDEIMRERLNMIVRLKRETSLDTFDRKKYDVSERKLNEYMGKIWPEQFGSKPVTDSREPVAPVGRSTSNSNGGRRRARDVDASSDDEEDEVCFGTWVGQATEFDLVLGLDGDSAPLTAFTDKERMASFKDSKHPFGRACIQDIIATNVWGVVLLLKWAAACSMLQSPNDVGKTHQVLRKGMKGTKKKKTLPVPFKDCNPFLQAEFKRLHATNMPADRKKGFWRLLSNLPGAASEAFRPRIVKSSWHKCGFYPLSIHMILDKCTLWRKKPEDGGLSDEEKKAVLEAIPGLQDIAFRKGRVSDAEMLAVLPFLSRYPTGLVHDLGDLVVNRDRCCLVLHPSFLEARQVAADEARARDPSLKKKPLKKKKPAKNAVVWEEFSQHSHRCTAAEIVEQLEIRDIHPGFAKKKEALLAMFEKYSALPDKRYVNVAAAAAPVVATARAPPVRPALVLGPSSHVGLEQLRAAQSALPATPQRRVAAAGAQFFGGGGPASAISPAVSSPRRSPRSGAVAAARGGGVKKVRVCAVCKNAGHQKNSSKCPMRDSLILQNPQVFQLSD